MTRVIVLFLLMAVCMSCAAQNAYDKDEKAFDKQFALDQKKENFVTDITHATLDGVPVVLEIADDPKERQAGLSFRKSLPKDHGMIFIFDHDDYLAFWMKDTYIDLDIAFVDAEGKIREIYRMQRLTYTVTHSKEKARYAIEMPAGWFAKHHVLRGSIMELEAIKPRLYDETVDAYVKR